MAVKKFYHDIDLLNIGQILGGRKQNVTTAQREALALTLGAGNEGLSVWDTDLKVGFTWDGSQFIRDKDIPVDLTGHVVFKGTVDASAALDDGVQNVGVEAEAGHQYVVAVAGTLSMTGVSFAPVAEVNVGDTVLFISATEAYVIEGNNKYATVTENGLVRLASEAEVLAGVEATAAVTAATLTARLEQYIKSISAVRQYFETANLTADVAYTVTHGLNLADQDAFTFNVMEGGESVSVQVASVDANSFTITAPVAVTGAKITVTGAEAVA